MAYDNNINPGNPPLVWSRIKEAFDKVNENFTIIGSNLARERELTIAHIESGTAQSNPVRIVTTEIHDLVDNQQVFVFNTGISQLDNNEYYVKYESETEVLLYSDQLLTTKVDGTAFDAYSSGGGRIQGFSEYAGTDFENLNSNVSPNTVSTFNLGSEAKPWKALYVGQYADDDANSNNGVWLGTAQIRGNADGSITLPEGSTVGTDLIINDENTFFKAVQVDGGNRVEADEFADTINLISGTAISMNVDSGAESITINNTGVTQLAAGSGLSVSAATGNITVTNTGVRSLTNVTALPTGRTEGAGININGTTGDGLKITNTGVLEVQPGSAALTVFTDAATGIVTITNASPAGNAFRFVDVDGLMSPAIEANSVAGTLNFVSGNGISLSGNAASDTVTVAFSGVADITGSVFADDSTKMVDAVENEIYATGGFFGNLTGNVTGNITGDVTGNVTGNVTGDTTGYHTGDVKGSIFGDDSTKLVDAVEGEIYGTIKSDNWMLASDSYLTIANGGATGPGPIQIVASANLDLSAGAGQTINANRNIVASGGVTGNLTGNTTGYHTGDVTGSVFADDSTVLVDGVDGVLRGTHVGDMIGSVFADNSTMIVNGIDGSLAYYPTTPSDWNGTPPTTVGEALDRLATLVKTLNAGTGA
jgi:hypothetical protein